ncbi:unnamed protein product [Leptidea sinapis]|uniref:Uncharacterized protein n=1 Tax=Leptidea sinapis TaxID=189913 RepID=A0A5E4QTK4_9NEOP|nr:unnamed protein product [Leptidea sinapis]
MVSDIDADGGPWQADVGCEGDHEGTFNIPRTHTHSTSHSRDHTERLVGCRGRPARLEYRRARPRLQRRGRVVGRARVRGGVVGRVGVRVAVGGGVRAALGLHVAREPQQRGQQRRVGGQRARQLVAGRHERARARRRRAHGAGAARRLLLLAARLYIYISSPAARAAAPAPCPGAAPPWLAASALPRPRPAIFLFYCTLDSTDDEDLPNNCLQVPKTSSFYMQTGKATMKEMENKLNCAAKKLKKSKDLCQILLKREECELEIQKIRVAKCGGSISLFGRSSEDDII